MIGAIFRCFFPKAPQPVLKQEPKEPALTKDELEIIDTLDYQETDPPFEQRKEILTDKLKELQDKINRRADTWLSDVDINQLVDRLVKDLWIGNEFVYQSQILKRYILQTAAVLNTTNVKEFERRVEILAGGKQI